MRFSLLLVDTLARLHCWYASRLRPRGQVSEKRTASTSLARTASKYPVDPKYHLGHQPGHEWWRIKEQAIEQGWTRKELNDYANSEPLEFYRVEDGPGNLSHAHELPREGT